METREGYLAEGNSKEYNHTEFFQLSEKYHFTSTILNVLLEISADLHTAGTFNEVGRLLFKGLKNLGYAEDSGCKLCVYFEDEDLFKIVFFKHRHKPKSYFVLKSKLSDLKMFTKLAIDSKETILIKDSYSQYALNIDPNLKSMSRRTMIFIPLFHKEKLLGLFSYARGGVDSISEELFNLLLVLGNYTSLAIEILLNKKYAHKYENVQKNRNAQIKPISYNDMDLLREFLILIFKKCKVPGIKIKNLCLELSCDHERLYTLCCKEFKESPKRILEFVKLSFVIDLIYSGEKCIWKRTGFTSPNALAKNLKQITGRNRREIQEMMKGKTKEEKDILKKALLNFDIMRIVKFIRSKHVIKN